MDDDDILGKEGEMKSDHHRRLLADRLRADLLGPVSDNEILECKPTDRYLTGILTEDAIFKPTQMRKAGHG